MRHGDQYADRPAADDERGQADHNDRQVLGSRVNTFPIVTEISTIRLATVAKASPLLMATEIGPRRNNPIAALDLDELSAIATLPKHVRDLSFIQTLRNASLDDGIDLVSDALARLRNPPKESLQLEPDLELVLSMFFALEHSSEDTYDVIRQSIHKSHPDSSIPSFYRVKQILADLCMRNHVSSNVPKNTSSNSTITCRYWFLTESEIPGDRVHINQCPLFRGKIKVFKSASAIYYARVTSQGGVGYTVT